MRCCLVGVSAPLAGGARALSLLALAFLGLLPLSAAAAAGSPIPVAAAAVPGPAAGPSAVSAAAVPPLPAPASERPSASLPAARPRDDAPSAVMPSAAEPSAAVPPPASRASSAVGAATAPSQAPLGVWLTTVDSAVLYEPAEARQALAFLQANGFRRAALPLYTAGTVLWSPAPWRNPLGIPIDPRLPDTFGRGPGPTASLLTALGQGGIERVGWFEFGLMAPRQAPWLRGREDLLLRDASGATGWQESPGLERVWLNPMQPEVQQLLEDLVVDACTSLPLDAVQFDDHLGYPVRFGYDAFTLAAWRASEGGRRDPSPDPLHPAWIAWRSQQVTALLERLRGAMRSACPQVRLSVSPNPQEFSYSSYLADWSDWVRRGLVDEVVVQIYRQQLGALKRELAHPSLAAASRRVPVRIGLLAGLRSQPKDPALLRRELALVRERGFSGIDLFFYESARLQFAGQSSAPAQAEAPAEAETQPAASQLPAGASVAPHVTPGVSPQVSP